MNSDFPMIISMLRRERRLSQKQVAADLGISQALSLSLRKRNKRMWT